MMGAAIKEFTPKGAATRGRIIAGAAALIRGEYGGEVTLDDVLAATRTSKSQLFHYFPAGKEELFLAVAEYEAQLVLDEQQPHLGQLDSWQSWEAWRQLVIRRYRAQGPNCALSSLMSQIGRVPGAAAVSIVLLDRWQDYLRSGLIALRDQRELAADVDVEHESAALVAGVQGGAVVLRTTGSTVHLEAILDVLFERLRAGMRGPSNAL